MGRLAKHSRDTVDAAFRLVHRFASWCDFCRCPAASSTADIVDDIKGSCVLCTSGRMVPFHGMMRSGFFAHASVLFFCFFVCIPSLSSRSALDATNERPEGACFYSPAALYLHETGFQPENSDADLLFDPPPCGIRRSDTRTRGGGA